MIEVNTALQACRDALDDWHKGSAESAPMTIIPKAVVYDSASQRDQQFQLYLERNPALLATYDVAE